MSSSLRRSISLFSSNSIDSELLVRVAGAKAIGATSSRDRLEPEAMELSPASAQRLPSEPLQPQCRPSVLGSYLAPPSWVVTHSTPASCATSWNSSKLLGQSSSLQPSRAAQVCSQLAPPALFTQVTPDTGTTSASSRNLKEVSLRIFKEVSPRCMDIAQGAALGRLYSCRQHPRGGYFQTFHNKCLSVRQFNAIQCNSTHLKTSPPPSLPLLLSLALRQRR